MDDKVEIGKVEIGKVVFKIGNKTLEVTLDEVQRLRKLLNDTFGDIPYFPPVPYIPYYPYCPGPAPEITWTISDSIGVTTATI